MQAPQTYVFIHVKIMSSSGHVALPIPLFLLAPRSRDIYPGLHICRLMTTSPTCRLETMLISAPCTCRSSCLEENEQEASHSNADQEKAANTTYNTQDYTSIHHR